MTDWSQDKQISSYAGSIAADVAVAAIVSPVLWIVEIPGFPDNGWLALFPAYLVVVSIVFFFISRFFLTKVPVEHRG